MSEEGRQKIYKFVNSEIMWKGMGKEEDPESDDEVTEIQEVQEVYSISKKHLRLLIPAVAITLLLGAFIVIFPKNRNGLSMKDLDSIDARVSLLEKWPIESDSMNQRLALLQKQAGNIQQWIEEMDRSGNSVEQRLEKLIQEIRGLQENMASVIVNMEASKSDKKTRSALIEQRYHKVHPGENLFRIALKYRSSVHTL